VSRDSRGGQALPLLAIAIALLCVYVPYVRDQASRKDGASFLRGDPRMYRAAVVSLLEDHDLVLSDDVKDPFRGYGPQLALGRDGDPSRLVPKHPILMPILSLPFYALWRDTGLLVFNVAMLIGLVCLLYLLCARYFDTATAMAAALLFGVATLFLNYSWNYSPDVFSTLLVVGGVLLVLERRHAAGACVLGLSLFAKVTNLPLVALAGLWIAWDVGLRRRQPMPAPRARAARLAAIGAAFALGLLPMLVTNQLLYGGPLVTGYHRAWTEHGIESYTTKFGQPFWPGLRDLLIHHRKGILTTNPVLLISLVGVPLALRGPFRAEMAFLAALALAQLCFFAKHEEWKFSHYSNRYLMTFVALGAVFAAQVIADVRRRAGGAAGIARSEPGG
jgi:hypothetical protein